MKLNLQAVEILEKRYLRNGQTAEERFREIAKAIASAEEKDSIARVVEEDAYELMTSLKFLPNSPTLANAGRNTGTLSACISGETLVYTKAGLKPMRDIVVGDYVLTHKARFRKVNRIWSNGEREIIKYAHGRTTRKKFNLGITSEHPVLSSDGNWVKATNLTSPQIPTLWEYSGNFPTVFNMSLFDDGLSKDFDIIDGRVIILNSHPKTIKRSGLYDGRATRCFDKVENDPHMAWLLGAYAANGNLDAKSGIRFTLNSKNVLDIERIELLLRIKFGLDVTVEQSNFGNWTVIKAWNVFVKNFLCNTIGEGFAFKRVPEWIAAASNEYREAFICGISMDGILLNEGRSFRLALANPTLVYEVMLLARSIGLCANFTADASERLSKSPTSRCLCGENQVLHSLVKQEDLCLTEVFDMEVDEDHSFIAGDFIVHNCFVLGIEDSREGIFETLKIASHIQAFGGGTGFDFSSLRPKGAIVKSTDKFSSGPLTFLGIYSNAIKGLTQAGIRDGANMGVMHVWHPDIIDFITIKKSSETILTNFNLSVGMSDEFLEAVDNDKLWRLSFPGFDIIRELPARDIWNLIVEGAWENGEPGVIFFDTINKMRCPEDRKYGEMTATNPCGEMPLLSNEACNLGSINLSKFVMKSGRLDKRNLILTVKTCIRILDNIIDINKFPVAQIEEMVKTLRRIGLGVTGFADYLILRGIDYRSQAAVDEAANVMALVRNASILASEELAEERGPCKAFLNPPCSCTPRRNIAVNTIAPTGSLSKIMGTSAGIEPIPGFHYNKYMLGKIYEITHPLYQQFLDEGRTIPPYFVTAKQVSVKQHICIQAAFQRWVDNSISKTIVCPYTTTKEEVAAAIRFAHASGCKGITLYRTSSRTSEGEAEISTSITPAVPTELPERPRTLLGFNECVKTAKGKMYININFAVDKVRHEQVMAILKSSRPLETFIWIGKSGEEDHANTEAIGRMASRHLRRGLKVKELIKDLIGISADNSSSWDAEMKRIHSIPDCLARVLRNQLLNAEVVPAVNTGSTCKECGGEMISQEGCIFCAVCGFSERCS